MTSTISPARTTCRGCDRSALELVLDFGPQPLAGGFLAGPEAIASERRFPLAVHVCSACGLLQILDPVDPEVLFQDYSFASSTIGPLVDHFRAYAGVLRERFAPRTVVEFGCNDGVLLAPLQEAGVTAVGVDPSKNITGLARAKGLDVVTGYFDVATAAAIRARAGAADVVTGSNAFAHNDHPERILAAAREVLGEHGVLALEVMYAGDLLETLQWDTLYHEHLTFYSLTSLGRLLERHGFRVFAAERIPMHGGSLRVFAASDGRETERSARDVYAYEEEKKLADPATWHAFAAESLRRIAVVRDVYGALAGRKRIWGYGAAGKATMWVNVCEMPYLEAVVDASPLRAGKLMPGTHSPIVFPEEMRKRPPDVVFVTAWNYADHIRAKEGWFGGLWSTPLPALRFF
ncbi:MAG TPA: class I SAM-dependent methyltransferase [Dongiaceae bacterium]|nr:class I SAM-dependent methyltransferase [Dongiaceae bacterium]